MSFVGLAHELIVFILGLLTPREIRLCQQVCRRLNNLVAEDGYLQYILELDACGYVLPTVPRLDLSYADKIQFLRNHRQRSRTRQIEPTFIQFPTTQWTLMHCFVDGILAYGHGNSFTGKGQEIHNIHFYDIPSANKGTGLRHWQFKYEFKVICFTIQPEYDLLVLLEMTTGPVRHDELIYNGGDQLYRLHLRTISTNKPHPAAVNWPDAARDLALSATPLLCQFRIQVYGSLICIMHILHLEEEDSPMFCTRSIFDWVSGLEVARLTDAVWDMPSLCFLSSSHFVIPRSTVDISFGSQLQESDIEERVPLGWLDIYEFRKDNGATPTQPQAPVLVASCVLPSLGAGRGGRVKVHHSSLPGLSGFHKEEWSRYSPKIYELPSDNHFLNIAIDAAITHVEEDRDFGGLGPFPEHCSGTLLVPTQPLLRTVSLLLGQGNNQAEAPNRAISIPWESWGNNSLWLESYPCQSSSPWTVEGQLAVTVQGTSGVGYGIDKPGLRVVNLNPISSWFCVPDQDDPPLCQRVLQGMTATYGDIVLKRGFSRPVNTIPDPHREILVAINPNPDIASWYNIMANSENGEYQGGQDYLGRLAETEYFLPKLWLVGERDILLKLSTT